jgi:7-carboxy-7-deazaguanine synthase
LQGEARQVGLPTVFIRLTGCPLRCQYCDTSYAFHGGAWQTIAAVLSHEHVAATRHVCVTGGEPLAQKACIPLLQALCDAGHEVSLETSGSIDIGAVDVRVSRVVDLKTPGSLEQHKNRWENIPLLNPHDQIKFVICDRADFDWAIAAIEEHDLMARCEVLMSPSFKQLSTQDLASWVLASGLPIRFQMQLHKLLWGDEPGR